MNPDCLGENAKNQKFGNKRLQEYNKIRNTKVYSTTILRVKFSDGLILQGKFGSREKLGKVYELVQENLFEVILKFAAGPIAQLISISS